MAVCAATPQAEVLPAQRRLLPSMNGMTQIAQTATTDGNEDSSDENATDMVFGYCYEPAGGSGGETGYYYGMAIQLTDDMTQRFAGNKIVGIQLATSDYDTDKLSNPAPYPVTMFIAADTTQTALGSPLRSKAVKQDMSAPGQWVEYPLDEPYTIAAGEKVFIGFTCCAKDYYYPLMADNTKHSGGEPGCFLGYSATSSTDMRWFDYHSYVGFACIRIHVQGDNLPTNEVNINDLYAPTQVDLGNKIQAQLKVGNVASNTVRTIGINYTVNGGEPLHTTLATPSAMSYNSTAVVNWPIEYSGKAADNVKVEFTIDKVNGQPNNSTKCSDSFYTQVFNTSEGTMRNVVVEEGTGTWCQWCVRGIVALQELSEKYNDGSFIPIAIHYGDAMAFAPYKGFVYSEYSGLPDALVNRNKAEFGDVDPNTADLEATYLYTRTRLKSCADVNIDNIQYANDSTLLVTASAVFTFDNPEATYRWVYAVTENNVGPYPQSNGYSGGLSGEMGGWESLGSYVSHKFDDVARDINAVYGAESSVPASLVAGRSYAYTDTLSLARVTLTSEGIRRTADCRIIAMLVNSTTGLIENAISVDPADYIDVPALPDAAIREVNSDAALAPARFFDLQGRAVSTPREGHIYIMQKGSTATKLRF